MLPQGETQRVKRKHCRKWAAPKPFLPNFLFRGSWRFLFLASAGETDTTKALGGRVRIKFVLMPSKHN